MHLPRDFLKTISIVHGVAVIDPIVASGQLAVSDRGFVERHWGVSNAIVGGVGGQRGVVAVEGIGEEQMLPYVVYDVAVTAARCHCHCC
jgi:hypothetical protein